MSGNIIFQATIDCWQISCKKWRGVKAKKYSYGNNIQNTKTMCKYFIVFSILLFVLVMIANEPSDFKSQIEYVFAMASPFLLAVGSIHFLGSWPDVYVSEEGVFVEFLWTRLFVPWDGVISLTHVGSGMLGVTIVIVKKEYLTFFHRFYSLYTIGMLQPSFHIHSPYLQRHDLIKQIESRIK